MSATIVATARTEVGELLKTFIEDLARRYIAGVEGVRDPELSRQEFLIIERMAWYNLHTVSDIADKCGLLISTASAAVERLVKKGYLERSDDEHDRRVNRLHLVGPGRELLRQLDQMYRSIADAIVQQLDPDETAVVLRALARITEVTRTEDLATFHILHSTFYIPPLGRGAVCEPASNYRRGTHAGWGDGGGDA